MLSPTRFQFIGEVAELKTAKDWNSAALPKLWLYNLHYFDDLRAMECSARSSWHRDLIGRWIAENPPLAGNGWEPYPVSLRVANWIAWALAGNELDVAMRDSLAAQARVLDATLEFHLRGNHLLANAKALVFAGCYFSGPEAEAWLRTGLDLLHAEWREQILDDGAHFELSPMYHAVILEDVLDLVQLSRIFPAQLAAVAESRAWRTLALRMLEWLAGMSHADGEISFFNDAAFGISRTYGELAAYAVLLGIAPKAKPDPSCRFASSGYVRLVQGPFQVIFDMAEIGPSYLPGHGHADVLSLEVSFAGRRLVTNGGTSSYANGAVREEERSTAAHATVEIDGQNSSEVWASFRVGRRARPFDVTVAETPEGQSAAASHDGYRWLSGKPVHRREVILSPSGLRIHDRITGEGTHTVIGRFPLHPAVSEIERESNGWRLRLQESRILRVVFDDSVDSFLSEGYYAPTFGQRILRPVLAWRHNGALPLSAETRFEF
ncbi:MAG: alginate lyase family protein [bacterium]|nr:alginate lyase family protein [bacterium]